MGINVQHKDDERTVIMHFDKIWTWQDFYNAQAKMYQWLNVAEQSYALIIDLPTNTIIPRQSIRYGLMSINRKHPKIDFMVLSTTSSSAINIINLFNNITLRDRTKKIHTALTVEEAKSLVYDLRYNLPLSRQSHNGWLGLG